MDSVAERRRARDRARWTGERREKMNAARSERKQKHREEENEKNAAWYAANRESEKEKHRAYHQAHREEANAKRRAHYAANKEAHAETGRKWLANHPGFTTIQQAKRRGLIRNQIAKTLTAKEWAETLAYFDNRCAYCLKPLTTVHREHMIPLSRGGEHTKENVVPSCPSCNLSKHDKTLVEYLQKGP